MTYRQQCLNVVLQEGGDVLPVQDVPQPAVLPLHRHLVAAPTSAVGHVLQQHHFVFVAASFSRRHRGGRFGGNGSLTHLDEPGVVQSVPELQDLLLNHSSVVHLVPQHLVELRGHRRPFRHGTPSQPTQVFTVPTLCVIHSRPCW